MANLIDLAKGYLTSAAVGRLSSVLGEDQSNTQKALDGSLPAVLGGLIQRSNDTNGTDSLLDLIRSNAGTVPTTGTAASTSGNWLENIGDLFDGNPNNNNNLMSMGTGLLSSIFGNNTSGIANAISSYGGVKSSSASSILGLAASVLMSVLSRRVQSDGLNGAGLSSLLNDQKDHVRSAMPSGLGSLLAGLPGMGLLSGWFGKDRDERRMASSEYVAPAAAAATSRVVREEEPVRPVGVAHDEKERSSGLARLLPWLGLLLLALLGWYLLRSCDKKPDTTGVVADTVATSMGDIENAVDAKIDTLGEDIAAATARLGAMSRVDLPDGIAIDYPERGMETNLLAFIKDQNRAIDKDTWFNFDRILYKFGTTQLVPGSEDQIQDMAAILKAYPNVDLKLGGYTDSIGGEDGNMKLSQQRANVVKAELVKLGIAANRLSAEGYGEQHPVADNATPEGRAQNRRIAVRVTKK